MLVKDSKIFHENKLHLYDRTKKLLNTHYKFVKCKMPT